MQLNTEKEYFKKKINSQIKNSQNIFINFIQFFI